MNVSLRVCVRSRHSPAIQITFWGLKSIIARIQSTAITNATVNRMRRIRTLYMGKKMNTIVFFSLTQNRLKKEVTCYRCFKLWSWRPPSWLLWLSLVFLRSLELVVLKAGNCSGNSKIDVPYFLFLSFFFTTTIKVVATCVPIIIRGHGSILDISLGLTCRLFKIWFYD